MILRLSTLLIGVMVSFTLFGQYGDFPPDAELGKCFSKCPLPEDIHVPARTEQRTYTVYTGEKRIRTLKIDHPVIINQDGIIVAKVTLEVPKKPEKLSIYDLKEVKYDTQYPAHTLNKSDYGRWMAIVCKNEITPELIAKIVSELENRGFELDKPIDTVSPEFRMKLQLALFQKQYGLFNPGQLTLESLEALGIDSTPFKG